MHIHILGICGTFMGGIAAIAQALGHKVTGSDKNVYPPMSTQLEALGIELIEGFDTNQFDQKPDIVVIGNAMSRGNPAVEYVLANNLPYTSGPQWLLENVLHNKWVLAVSGTHGKTTTSSMLAWILEYAGMQPGFLIGGIPQNFNVSARVTDSSFFVIEADEYDSAFFDKRSKFVHYRPHTLVVNNLEFDHADIFNNLADIQRQFHHMIRMVPNNGLVIAPANIPSVDEMLAMGCWTPTQSLGSDWTINEVNDSGNAFTVCFQGQFVGRLSWSLQGQHNRDNAIMAIAAARHVGVEPQTAIAALTEYVNVKRRMELLGVVNNISVYDDFAHHPTAIETTLNGLKAKITSGRILAVLEPRSNTMKMGVHGERLRASWQLADTLFVFDNGQVEWGLANLCDSSETPARCFNDLEQMLLEILDVAQPDDHIVIMSNGGFENIHQRLLARLEKKYS